MGVRPVAHRLRPQRHACGSGHCVGAAVSDRHRRRRGVALVRCRVSARWVRACLPGLRRIQRHRGGHHWRMVRISCRGRPVWRARRNLGDVGDLAGVQRALLLAGLTDLLACQLDVRQWCGRPDVDADTRSERPLALCGAGRAHRVRGPCSLAGGHAAGASGNRRAARGLARAGRRRIPRSAARRCASS